MGDLADAVKATDILSVAIVEIDIDVFVWFIIYIIVNGVVVIFEGIVVEVFGYDVIFELIFEFIYFVRDVVNILFFVGGLVIGDHVELNVIWVDFVGGIFEFTVIILEMKVFYGTFVERHGIFVIVFGDSGNMFIGVIDPVYFVWEIVDGIIEGDDVCVTVDFSNGYDDIKVGWFEFDIELGGNYVVFVVVKYVTIHIVGDYDTFQDDNFWVFVFDWNDISVFNMILDYYNTIIGVGDEFI